MPRQFTYLSLLLLAALLAHSAGAQSFNVVVENYSLEKGLPHREVNALLQDSRGFIWAGTPAGISRFDGYRFQNYDKDSDGFLHEDIWRILEDAEGYFWLLPLPPYQDITIWHPVTRHRTSFREKFGKTASLPVVHPFFWSGGKNRVIVVADGNFNSLFYYHPSTGLQVNPLPDYRQIEILSAGTHTFLLADSSLLVEVDARGRQISARRLPKHDLTSVRQMEGAPDRFLCWSKSDADMFLAGTGEEDIRLLSRQSRMFPVLINSASSKSIGEDLLLDNNYLYRLNGEQVYDLQSDRENSRFIFPRSILFDQLGNLWLGSNFGLRRVTVNRNLFRRFLASDKPNIHNLPSVRGMIVHEGQLFVNREVSGPVAVDLKTGEKRDIGLPAGIPIYLSIARLQDGRLAAGDQDALVLISSQGRFLQRIKTNRKTYSLFQASPSTLWLGTDAGIRLLHLPTMELRELAQRPAAVTGIVYDMRRGKNGAVLLSTSDGFYVTDTLLQSFRRYSTQDTGRYFLPYDFIYHSHEAEDGSYWLATKGGGLLHLMPEGKQFPAAAGPGAGQQGHAVASQHPHLRRYAMADGLSNDVIYAVYPDRHGNLWLSSNNGIMCFNRRTGEVSVFLEEDGISYPEFNSMSHCMDEEGHIYFGGLNGVTAFHPDELLGVKSTRQAPLVITDFRKFDGKAGQLRNGYAEIIREGRIILRPSDRFFTLDLSLLNYQYADLTRFAWQLEGLDKDWNISPEHSLSFGRLPYGKYMLRIKAQDRRGDWSGKVLELPLEVLRPFYLQAWFFLLVSAVLVLMVTAYIRYRTRQLLRQKAELVEEVARRTRTIEQQTEELRGLDQLKSRFFANVSHELRTPLSLLRGPADSLLKQDYFKEKDRRLLTFMKHNISHLLKLVNEILELAKLESGRMEVELVPVRFRAFMTPLVSQFSSFGDSEHVRLKFEYRADPDLVIMLDQPKFEKIVHNFLSNAIKFTPVEREVELVVEEEEAHLLVKVRDQGPGIHPEDLPHLFDRFYQSRRQEMPVQGGTGIGLSLCRELATLLGGEVWAESEFGQGSTFFYRFPKVLATGAALDSLPAEEVVAATEKALAAIASFESRQEDGRSAVVGPEDRGSQLLIVEDNPQLREYMHLLLGGDYRVSLAENGLQAWQLLEEGLFPDLIISDLMMPVMDGFQLLERIKGSDRLRHLPVIMLTARADVQVRLQALRIGVDDYLTKPFVEEELRVRIANLLRNHRERLRAAEQDLSGLKDGEGSAEGQAPLQVISMADAEWLERAEQYFLKHIAEPEFKMEQAAEALHMSERHFRRQLKKLTGLSPNLYLRELRLQAAQDYLLQGRYKTIKETSFAVGFINVNYFSNLFFERFGKMPSAYLSQ